MASKTVKADKADKGAKLAPTRGPRAKVGRAEKVARRLNGISAKTPFKMKSAIFTVEALAKVPQSIQGFIVSRDKESVAFRHKRSNASKRMVVTVFPISDILELFGNEGEVAELTVMREVPVRKVQGTVQYSGSSVTVNTISGESVTFFRTNGVTVNVYAEDEEGSAPSNRGPKAKGEKSAKVVDIKSSKKRKTRDDDDGDL